MTKGNPYAKPYDRISHDMHDEMGDAQYMAWEEGYHSRDEVVNDLVRACERACLALTFKYGSDGDLHKGYREVTNLFPCTTLPNAYWELRTSIQKAAENAPDGHTGPEEGESGDRGR